MPRHLDAQPIGRQIALTAKLVTHKFNAALVEAGGSLPTWLVLSTLEREEWPTQHRIARALGIEGPTLTRHLDALEQMGLVERTRDTTDRRAIRVKSTAAGRALTATMLEAAKAFDTQLRSGLNRDELDQLRTLLARLEANLSVSREP
jgi:MarR family transcriptional regulator for hemolysin